MRDSRARAGLRAAARAPLDGRLQDRGPFAGHADQMRPLGGYVTLTSTFLVVAGAFAGWFHRSGRVLPETIGPQDLLLVSAATQKVSRIATKDRVTSGLRAPFTTFQGDAGFGEVDEAARGEGLRRAIGELLVCPYCLDVWIASGFTAGLLVAPRATRVVASVFTAVLGSDLLQLAYLRAEHRARG